MVQHLITVDGWIIGEDEIVKRIGDGIGGPAGGGRRPDVLITVVRAGLRAESLRPGAEGRPGKFLVQLGSAGVQQIRAGAGAGAQLNGRDVIGVGVEDQRDKPVADRPIGVAGFGDRDGCRLRTFAGSPTQQRERGREIRTALARLPIRSFPILRDFPQTASPPWHPRTNVGNLLYRELAFDERKIRLSAKFVVRASRLPRTPNLLGSRDGRTTIVPRLGGEPNFRRVLLAAHLIR